MKVKETYPKYEVEGESFFNLEIKDIAETNTKPRVRRSSLKDKRRGKCMVFSVDQLRRKSVNGVLSSGTGLISGVGSKGRWGDDDLLGIRALALFIVIVE